MRVRRPWTERDVLDVLEDEIPTTSLLETEDVLRRVLAELSGLSWERAIRDGWDRREIAVTPFPGAYGYAGVVVTLNGSPPRAIVLVPKETLAWMGGTMVVLDHTNRAQTLSWRRNRRAYQAVAAYLRARGYGAEGPPHGAKDGA